MAVVTTNLGAVTAYADAVAGGYTGTKAEWQALMASYGSVAEQAAESASQAAESASAASEKASEATTAAASANTAKNDAETAKNAAETAQGKAEDAQGAAEDAAENVSASAAQIQTNKEDITELKSDLSDTVIKPISLTMSNGNINSQGAVGGGDAGGYYKVSQAIDVSMASKIRIYDYYYGPALSTVTVLGKTGAVIDYLLNPASGNEYVDFTIPDNGEVAYVQGTSSNTPTVVIYTSSDSIDRKISTMENTIEKEFSSYLIDDGANWRE